MARQKKILPYTGINGLALSRQRTLTAVKSLLLLLVLLLSLLLLLKRMAM